MKLWRIQFFGKFEIWSPGGDPVVSPTLKAKAVIALLALDRKYGMSRDLLGQALWPDAFSDRRRDNVKQALASVRKIIGSANLEANASVCRLSDAFELESDLDSLNAHKKGFMPGFEGDWFDEVRRRYEEIDAQSEGSVSEALVRVLRWHARNDPDQMFDMMRSNVYLTFGIGPSGIEDLCQRVDARKLTLRRLAGWDNFWNGACLIAKDVDAAIAPLETAAAKGLEQNDLVLATESFVWAGYAHILRGRTREANRLALRAKDLVAGSNDEVLKSKAGNLRGTALLHMGRTQEAVQMLLASNEGFERNTFEWGQNLALCGLYQACDRKIDEAERLLAAPRQLASETGHVRLRLICDLADAHIRLAERSYEEASKAFAKLKRNAAELKADHFEIYAEEGLAMSAWNQGNRPEALRYLKSSRRTRSSTNMPYTNWDRQRMSVLSGKVSQA